MSIEETRAALPLQGTGPSNDLIERHIQFSDESRDPLDARLEEQGVPIWLVIDNWTASQGDVAAVARAYAVSEEAVEAALVYYRCNQAVIDSRIESNARYFA